MDPITEAREGIAYIAAELRNIHAAATDRDLDTDEQARFDAGEAEIVRLNGLVERHNKLAKLAEVPEVREVPEFHAPAGIQVKRDAFDLSDLRFDATPQELRSRGLRAIEQTDGLKDEHKERAEFLARNLDPSVSLRIAATGSEDYRNAFGKRLVDPFGVSLTPEEHKAEARAASLTGNAGGYAVPYILDPSIILSSDGSVNPFRQISRVIPTTQNVWKGVSSAGITAAFAAEAAAVADGAPTLAQPSVTAYKAHASVDYSIEIGEDWTSLQSEMLALFADAKDTLEATKFAVGSGSSEPYGIVTALAGTGSAINETTDETFTAADLYAVEEALGPRFRPRASWVANKSIYNKVRQFDTYGGASLWERIGAGMPSQLLGYNAYEASAMDGTFDATATANNYILVLGDFSNYVIVDRVGMSVEFVPHRVDGSGALTGQRALYMYWRVGADSVNDAAFTLLNLTTAA